MRIPKESIELALKLECPWPEVDMPSGRLAEIIPDQQLAILVASHLMRKGWETAMNDLQKTMEEKK